MEVVKEASQIGKVKAEVVRTIDDNWGRRKGGVTKLAKHGCNLNLELRKRGGTRSGESLKGRLGDHFSDYWKLFSSKGGITSLERKTSLFRKSTGPLGERMFNELEAELATSLYKFRIPYVYEPKITMGASIIIPDFVTLNRVIECTYWANVTEKARSLVSRFTVLQAIAPDLLPMVVTNSKLAPAYARHLHGKVEVLSLHDFQKRVEERLFEPPN